VALFELGRGWIARQPSGPPQAGAPYRQHVTWQKAVLELIGTCLVLIGIGIGVQTLRFVLLLMHGVFT
jgi:hypothetical protein